MPDPSKFPFGHVVATRGALEQLDQKQISDLLRRHGQLDPGELDAEDVEANELSLREGV